MKIEKLTDNKIRIIFNIDDLAQKNIDINSLIKNTDSSQKFFKTMLKQAKKEVGFEVQDSKLLIEAYISTDGFFVVTFTKIANQHSDNLNNSFVPKAKRKNMNPSSDIAIYEFRNFDEFCSFCTYLKNSSVKNIKGFAKLISLYDYNSKYYLVFNGINHDFKDISFLYTSISEFAKLTSTSSFFESKLVEYGKTVFKKNAIEYGINLFSNA